MDLKLMLPALSVTELTRIYTGMKAAAPPAVFQDACRLAEGILEEPRWRQLSAAIVKAT